MIWQVFLSGLSCPSAAAASARMELHIWRAIFKLPSTWLAQVPQETWRTQVEKVQLDLVY